MKKGLSLVALLVLSFTMGTMFVYLIVDGYGRSYFSLSLLLVFVVLWLINMATKFKEVDKSEVDFKVKESIFSFLAILIPTLIVYLATTYLELDNIIIVGFVSFLGVIFFKDLAAAITIGAFLGMSLFQEAGYYGLIVAVLIAFLLESLSKELFKGYGGKLGTISFTAGLLTFYLFKIPFHYSAGYQGLTILYVFIISIVASLTTYLLNNKFNLGPIMAYSVVSMFGALIFLPFGFASEFAFSSIIFGASFIGMTSQERFKNILSPLLAAIIFAFLIVISQHLHGIGGRSGTTALISVLIIEVIIYFFEWLKPEKSKLGLSNNK